MRAVRFAAAIAASTAFSVLTWSFMGAARALLAVCCVAVIVWEVTAGGLRRRPIED